MEPLCCQFRNTTDRMCVVRACGPGEFLLERVVFPFETLHFSCPPGSDVTIERPARAGAGAMDAQPLRMPAESLELIKAPSSTAPAWWPARPARPIGVRECASAVCLDRP